MSNHSSDKGRLERIRGALTSGSQSAFGGRSESGAGADGGLAKSVFTVSTAVLLENAQEPEGRGSGVGDPPASSSGSGSSLSALRLSLDSEQENSSETLRENSVRVGESDGSANEVNVGALGVIEDESGDGEQSVGKDNGGRFGFVGCFSRRAAVDVLPESQVRCISDAVVIDLNMLGIGEFGDGERVEPVRDDIGAGAWGDVGLAEKVDGEELNTKIVDDVLGVAEGYRDEDCETFDGRERDGDGKLGGWGRNVGNLEGDRTGNFFVGVGNECDGVLGGSDGGRGFLGSGDGGGGSLGCGKGRTYSFGQWKGVDSAWKGEVRRCSSLDGEHCSNRTLRRSNQRSLELGGCEFGWGGQHGDELGRGNFEEADGADGERETEKLGDANQEGAGSSGFGCGNFPFFGARNRKKIAHAIPAVQRVAGHVIIDMTRVEDEVQVSKPSKYLKTQYNTMYILGMSTYKTWKEMDKKDWFWLILDFLQKTLFCFWVFNSLLHSVREGKFNFMYFLFEAKYSKFVLFVFYIVCFLGKMCSSNLFGFRRKKTDKMMAMIEQFEEKYQTDYVTDGITWNWMFVPVLAVLTWLLAVLVALFGIGFSDWSFEELLLTNSGIFSEDIFIWSSKNMTDAVAELNPQYGKNLTTTTITFGTIVLVGNFASYVVVGMMLDMAVIVAVTVYQLFSPFMKEVKEVTENVPYENVMEWDKLQRRREKLWLKLREIKMVFRSINAVYNPLLKMMHIGNMLMYVVFMVLFIFAEDVSVVLVAMYAYNIIKAEVSYFIAGRIAEQNDAIRAWIRNWAMYTGKIRVGDKEIDVIVILDELTKDPIGLGEGNSLIHHTFHFKLLGLGISIFFSVADDYHGNGTAED